ncbi:MAG TPA: DUF4230 domain-containing protein [Candidatus Levybacteria bacterium]|nr:DUF4230 domain-containing protein [Candidatus Levybacteria bacterium]
MVKKYPQIIFAGLIVIVVLVIGLFIRSQFTSKYEFRNGAAVVKEMRALNRLETAQFTIEKVIDAGTSGNEFQNLLFGDQLLFIAHGEVVGGFDLSKLNEDDISVSDTAISLTLPQPEILFVRLDSEQSRVYDRRQGLLTRGDKDLESEARMEAERAIRQAACESGILTQAIDNGRKQLTTILRSFGFEQVSIQIPMGSC